MPSVQPQRLAPRLGELDQGTPRVGGVGATLDQGLRLELADGLGHRLLTDPLRGRQVARAPGPFAVEPSEHRAVGEREAVLGAQAPHELSEHHAQLAGDEGDIHRWGHSRHDYTGVRSQINCAGILYSGQCEDC